MSSTARTKDSSRTPTRDKGRVLLVADDPSMSAFAEPLEQSGFVVAGVAGGAKALVALQHTRPHVVVVDAKLKGIKAVEFSRMLTDAQDSIPVALVGGAPSNAKLRAEAMAAGASDYFHLPTELELLVARVQQLVDYKLMVERLRAEADRDYLTGLANRRRFRKALGQEVERWRRYGIPCSLLMLDVDHLKKINDTHGHPAGDRVIRAVADAMTKQSRDNDTAARLGGEEFALLLAGVGSDKAFVAAERLRLAVSAEPVDEMGTVTVSVGVASCPSNAETERDLFSASDAALYRAKREGRNLSVLSGSDKSGKEDLKTDQVATLED